VQCQFSNHNDTHWVFPGKGHMYRMGRLASIQPVTSAILKMLSHLVIFLRRGGPFYSIYDWQRSRVWISEIGAPIGAPVFQITDYLSRYFPVPPAHFSGTFPTLCQLLSSESLQFSFAFQRVLHTTAALGTSI
jgi:hypothetical protein